MIISLIQNEVKAKHWNPWNKINVILHQARSEAMRWVFWSCEDALALIPQTISLVFVRPQHAKILIARELPLVSCQKAYFSWRTWSRSREVARAVATKWHMNPFVSDLARPHTDVVYSVSQEICTRFCCTLLCCGYAIVYNELTWSIYPYSSGLLCWHWGNR